MPGESILVIDDSLAVQDIVQTALQNAGYSVTTASNGASALTFPGIEDVDLMIVGNDLAGLSGEETTRILKQHAQTHPIPVLMLVPDHQVPERENMTVGGTVGYLLKPFDPESLVKKVDRLMEQRNLDELARQYLADSADRMMQKLADEQIGSAVERKTQLIVERCIQNITTTVDQRARGEVEERVSELVSDKEQELVKLTVREVANSMVEKLAVTKVQEAMQGILRDETEKAVRRICDQNLPNQIRERTKEMLANILPREVEKQLQKTTEKMVPEISEQIVGTVENVANRAVPRAAREMLPPVVESQVAAALERSLPRQVADLVARELSTQMTTQIQPLIHRSTSRIKKTVLIFNAVMGLLLCGAFGFLMWLLLSRGGR